MYPQRNRALLAASLLLLSLALLPQPALAAGPGDAAGQALSRAWDLFTSLWSLAAPGGVSSPQKAGAIMDPNGAPARAGAGGDAGIIMDPDGAAAPAGAGGDEGAIMDPNGAR